MRASPGRAGAVCLIILSSLAASAAAYAEDLLVMPYACSIMGGRPVLTPAREQSHRILGPREQRPFRACSPANPDMCRNWTVHRFDVDCEGARVPWAAVVASFAEDTNRRAWMEDGRLVLGMPRSWSFEPDDRCARPLGLLDRLNGRMRRYCREQRAMAPPVVEMPRGFAPMLGIDAIFVRGSGPLADLPSGPPGPPPIVAGGSRIPEPGWVESPRAPPRPSMEDSDFHEDRGRAERRVLGSVTEAPPDPRQKRQEEPVERPAQPKASATTPATPPPVAAAKAPTPPPPAKAETSPVETKAAAATQAKPPAAPAEPKTKSAALPKAAAKSSSSDEGSPPAPASDRKVAAAQAAPDQPIVPKIINRAEPPGESKSPALPKEQVAEAPAPKAEEAAVPSAGAAAMAPAPAGSSAASSSEDSRNAIAIELLSVVRTPTAGIVGFGALALVVLAGFAMARRRERLSGAPPVRDLASVSLGGSPRPTSSKPNLPVPHRPSAAQPPRPVQPPPLPAAPASAPANAWANRMPRSRAEAVQVLGMGVSPETTEAAIKRIVDGLRMSWHPDLAKDDADRQLREFRLKQINAAWDLIRGQSVERLDS